MTDTENKSRDALYVESVKAKIDAIVLTYNTAILDATDFECLMLANRDRESALYQVEREFKSYQFLDVSLPICEANSKSICTSNNIKFVYTLNYRGIVFENDTFEIYLGYVADRVSTRGGTYNSERIVKSYFSYISNIGKDEKLECKFSYHYDKEKDSTYVKIIYTFSNKCPYTGAIEPPTETMFKYVISKVDKDINFISKKGYSSTKFNEYNNYSVWIIPVGTYITSVGNTTNFLYSEISPIRSINNLIRDYRVEYPHVDVEILHNPTLHICIDEDDDYSFNPNKYLLGCDNASILFVNNKEVVISKCDNGICESEMYDYSVTPPKHIAKCYGKVKPYKPDIYEIDINGRAVQFNSKTCTLENSTIDDLKITLLVKDEITNTEIDSEIDNICKDII